MGNTVRLKAMRFTDLRTGEVNEGFVIYDDNDDCFDYMLRGVPDDDRELLATVARDSCGDVLHTLLDTAKEIGMICGRTRLEPEEVETIIDECGIDIAEELPEGLMRKSGVCGGALCLEDSRIPVWVICELYGKTGGVANVHAAYPHIAENDITMAIAYAADHAEEIAQDKRECSADGPEPLAPHEDPWIVRPGD